MKSLRFEYAFSFANDHRNLRHDAANHRRSRTEETPEDIQAMRQADAAIHRRSRASETPE